MNIDIRLPCSQYITVKVDIDDNIIMLKEKIGLKNISFIKEHFTLHLPGQEQPLSDDLPLASLSNVSFLQLIPDTLDISKIMYDLYSYERHNVTPVSSCSSIEEIVRSNSLSSLRIYTSSGIANTTNCLPSSPEKPIIPPVPKAAMRKKSIKHVNDDEDSCVIV